MVISGGTKKVYNKNTMEDESAYLARNTVATVPVADVVDGFIFLDAVLFVHCLALLVWHIDQHLFAPLVDHRTAHLHNFLISKGNLTSDAKLYIRL